MRLTLRTLLAYLDDILEPTQAKEIGKKVAESNVASTLVSRIKEVTRRRRLTAPDVSGPGSGVDANLVAEYLDNTLPAERVADIEKVCLDSDTHLAEVAACHQILALVLGEPVEVQSQSRERMYALVPSHAGGDTPAHGGAGSHQAVDEDGDREAARDAVRFLSGTAGTAYAPEPEATATPAKAQDERIPGIPGKRPFWSMSLPYVIVGGIALIWFGLFLLDPALLSGILGTKDERGTTVAVSEVSPDDGEENELHQLALSREGDDAVSAETPADDLEMADADDELDVLVDGEDEEMTDDSPATTAEIDSADDDSDLTSDADDNGETETSTEVAAVDKTKPIDAATLEKPATTASPLVPGPDLEYSSKEGVLLRYDANEGEWFMLPHRSIVRSGEELASPVPFRAWLDVLDKTCRVTMLEGTRLHVLFPTEAALCGFDIREGRVLFEANQPQVDLSLSIAGQLWRLELLSGDAVCGIEVMRPLPGHFEEDMAEVSPRSRIVVHRGTVRLADGDNHVFMMERHDSLMLTGPPADDEVEQGVIALSLTEVPNWINPEDGKQTTIARRNAMAFEKEFALDQSVALSIPAVMRYDDPRLAEFAAHTLGLLGQGYELVHALAIVSASHPEVRLAAMIGLKKWMADHPNELDDLKASLQKYFPNDAEILYQLLWGYNREDLQKKEISQQLVNWLSHDNLVVRELAFYYIRSLTGKTNEYRPNGPANQRTLSVNRWQNQLDKDGALIK